MCPSHHPDRLKPIPQTTGSLETEAIPQCCVIVFRAVFINGKQTFRRKKGRNVHPGFQDTKIVTVTAGTFNCLKHSADYTARKISLVVTLGIQKRNFFIQQNGHYLACPSSSVSREHQDK